MGWLRDLMDDASPPVRSYGALARAALKHPDWPEDTRAQSRSLSALFSKLDRDQELEWLADRPRVRVVLAEVLGAPAASLERRLESTIAESDRARNQVRLDDVPFARVIDLTSEPLPPGIPSLVLQPPRWERLYWFAPPGSGRSLAGSFLAARGLAAHVDAVDWQDASTRLAQSGALFVELHSGRDLSTLLAEASRAPICVASPVSVDRDVLERAGFSLVTSPPPSSIVDPLIRWLAPRLPPDAPLDVPAATEFLERALGAGLARSLGDLLGLLGFFDEIGAKHVSKTTFEDLAHRLVLRRLGALKRRGERPPTWHDEGLEVLVGMARRALTDSDLPWEAPRDLAAWADLVPPEQQRAVDPEWLRISLSKTASTATLREVERALKELPPGGYGVVTSLSRAGLLRRAPDRDAFYPAPCWVGTLVARRARQTLLGGSPFEWGEALLEPTLAKEVFDELLARVERNADGVIDEVLEFGDHTNAAYAAAVESVARAVGLLLLSGAIEAPESLDELWDAALDLSIDVAGASRPRIPMPPGADNLLSEGAYFAAMLACSEVLPARMGRRHVQFRPWLVPRPPRPRVVLEAIAHAVRTREPGLVDWEPPALALVARLLARVDANDSTADGTPASSGTDATRDAARECGDFSDAELPYRLAAAIASETLTWPLCRATFKERQLTRSLPRVMAQVDIDGRRAARAIFEAWKAAHHPDTALLGSAAQYYPELWSDAPLTIWSRALLDGLLPVDHVPWAFVAQAAWQALVFEHAEIASSAAPWRGADATRIRAALARSLPSGHGATTVWTEHEALAVAAAARHLEAGLPVMHFARRAPGPCVTDVLRLLDAHPLSEGERGSATAFLHGLIARRHPEWRTAYALLPKIEHSTERGRSPRP